ncbi:hypothetical protein [Algoriphagus antarcticus]|uniref:Uncharacterized protein n=1 Tax=Algoriphagus antarcticus TaxID=238540 RepID=A0A3E0DML5_9BACT|nr:hypothetical protein [Algoriphagus antarcticus]REG83368.1 hypothetical protein C8N25_11813 [Algoriphagus antarcticus]
MKNPAIITSSFILGSLILVSCSTNKLATTGANDNLYFMASDAKVATEYAVQNNNPEQFQTLSSNSTESIPQESFSSRNVNPDYIARYQAEENTSQDDVVYFDEAAEEESNPDINSYDNYRVGNSGNNSNFNSSMAFNMGMMYGMNSFAMSPFGMNSFAMSPFGMGGFYDPFWGSGFGFRPGFSMNLGFGFGNPFFRPMFGMPMFGMGGFGYGGFHDPWGSMFGMGGFGYPGFGYSPMFSRNPIYVLPGGEYGDRRVVRGARGTRGSTLGASRSGNVSNSALQPSTARAQARRDVLNNRSNSTGRRVVSNSDNSRASARDFSSSQNDFYNSRARTGSTRNVSSAAMDRPVSRTRSAMPSARPSVGTTNSRSIDSGRGGTVRNSYPSNSRSASPSYNRSNVPSRTSSPSYNRGGTNTRTVSPMRMTTPTRSNTPTFSTPSRSSGGGGSTGGASRGTSTPSRGGRGN